MKFFKGESSQPLKNLLALGIVQFTNYLLPLLTLPYLIRIVGLEKFGQVSMAQAIMFYFVIIGDYSHNLTSTQQISIARSNAGVSGKVVSITIVSKAILLVIAAVILTVLILSFDFFSRNSTLYILGFTIVIGQTFFPMWFFQGIEKLRYITILNMVSRISLTLSIFLLIRKPEHYIYILPIYGSAAIMSSILGWLIMFTRFHFQFVLPGTYEVKENLRSGFGLFISSLANNTYVNSGIIILGLFVSETAVGMYAVADKLLLVFRQGTVILGQAIFPTLCKLRIEEEQQIFPTLKKVVVPFATLIVTGCVALFFAPGLFSAVLTGRSFPEINILTRILAFVPILLTATVVLNQLLLAYNFRNASIKIYLSFAVVSVLLNLGLSFRLGAVGTALNVLITETTMCCTFLIVVRKLGFYRNVFHT